MPARSPAFTANGNIRPSRFVQIDATEDFTVLEVDTAGTDKIIGISQEGVRRPPGADGEDVYAAHQNETIHVYGIGEQCLLTAGAAITRGSWLKSDAEGRGVPMTLAEATNTQYGAIALESTVTGAGDLIRVIVCLGSAAQA